jgi:hypothetical protein
MPDVHKTEKTQVVAQGGKYEEYDKMAVTGGTTTEDQIARNAGPQPAPKVK